MEYILKPSLEHIALVQVAIIVWNHSDIKVLIKKFNFRLHGSEKSEEWRDIENRVIEKIQMLPQTGILKDKILGCIKPIGLQILKWMEYHCTGHYIRLAPPDTLSWTPQGTVDRKETAKILIENGNLDVITCYKLACIYCLEDNIRELWNKIPENRRKFFHSENRPGEATPQDLVFIWTCDIKNEMAEFENMIQRKFSFAFSPYRRYSPYQYALEYMLDRNKAAVDYFLNKLTPEEKETCLIETALSVATRHGMSYFDVTDIPDILCFLMSQMDQQQQTEVFKSCPCAVLECLLDWPWQSLFMETANRMWAFLDKINYERMLQVIIHKVIHGFKYFNYPKLFGEFWQQSPDSYKRYVIDELSSGLLLSKLFKIKDKINIQLILLTATPLEKHKLIFCSRGRDICRHLIYNDEWDLLEFFIEASISTKDDMTIFKKEIEEHLLLWNSNDTLLKYETQLDKLSRLLNDFICRWEKMKGEENSTF